MKKLSTSLNTTNKTLFGENMIDLREYTATNYNSTRLPNAQILGDEDKKNFKKDLLEGFDKICDLKDSFLNKPALVMGHGPSLLDIDKEKYKSHLKITCNWFHKINFFDDFIIRFIKRYFL